MRSEHLRMNTAELKLPWFSSFSFTCQIFLSHRKYDWWRKCCYLSYYKRSGSSIQKIEGEFRKYNVFGKNKSMNGFLPWPGFLGCMDITLNILKSMNSFPYHEWILGMNSFLPWMDSAINEF
jgi:hypothetical protein